MLYVDGMLIATKSKHEIARLKTQLSKEFDMKDLGAAKKILGMEIYRDRRRGQLKLSHRSHVVKIVVLFSMR